MVQRFLQAATSKGILQKNGADYTLDGKSFDPKDTKKILEIINREPVLNFSLKDPTGRLHTGRMKEAVASLKKLSEDRAEEVRKSVNSYATDRGLILEQSQIRPLGVGVSEPVDGFPTTDEGYAKNRRVEFSIIKVPADKVSGDEFDL